MAGVNNSGIRGVNYTTSIFVVVFYLTFIFVVFCGFAGYLSRVTLGKNLATEGDTLDKLIYLATIEEKIADTKLRLNRVDNEASLAQIELAQQNFEIQKKWSQVNNHFWQIFALISDNKNDLEEEFFKGFVKEFGEKSVDGRDKAYKLISIVSNIKYQNGTDISIRDNISKSIKINISNISSLTNQIRNIEDVSLKQSQTITGILYVKNSHEDEINYLRSIIKDLDKKIELEKRAIISLFKNSMWGIPYFLIKTPTIILTLVVTVAAGGLGATVGFTRKFLTGSDQTIAAVGRLFVSVGEGVAASVAIFLFAGAGMLMLAQGGATTHGQVELSPYMVAFIAFVSGFMAEDAFKSIQNWGEKVFGGDERIEEGEIIDPDPVENTDGDVDAAAQMSRV